MEDTSAVMSDPMASPSYTYSDPISSFFNGIIMIIILFLIIVFIVLIFIGKAFGIVKDAPAPPPATKEKFKDGPPYPRCQTNGAFAMF